MSSKRRMSYPLHSAAKRSRLERLRDLLAEDNVVVDAKDAKGFTPFALACRKRQIGVMRALLEAGCDPNQLFKHNRRTTTAAFLATRTGDREMLELLLQFKVSANDCFEGATLLTSAAAANFESAKDVVKLLLDNGAKVDSHGQMALRKACCYGKLDVARLLLAAGAAPNAEDECGRTPLHDACFCGAAAVDMLKLLLDNSAQVDGPCGTALHRVCELGKPNVARFLLEAGMSVNAADEAGKTPLELACSSGLDGLGMVELLLEFKAEVNAKCFMAALYSDSKSKLERMKLLLSRGGDSLSKMPRLGPKALSVAVRSGCEEITRLMLDLGASPNAPFENASPLYSACRLGHHRVAGVLIDSGAIVNAGNSHRLNETSLFRAITSKNPDKMAVLRTIDLLEERGADINWRNALGSTPLHWACRKVKLATHAVVRSLLEKGADANALDGAGDAPLHFLCNDRYTYQCVQRVKDGEAAEAARALLEYGAEVEEARESNGATPLVHAVIRDHPKTMQQLFEFKLDRMPTYDDDDE